MAPRGDLNEDTRLPLRMVVAIAVFAAAVAGWASRVESGITAWAKTRSEVEGNSRRLMRMQGDIRLIKEKLGIPKELRAQPEPEDEE